MTTPEGDPFRIATEGPRARGNRTVRGQPKINAEDFFGSSRRSAIPEKVLLNEAAGGTPPMEFGRREVLGAGRKGDRQGLAPL